MSLTTNDNTVSNRDHDWLDGQETGRVPNPFKLGFEYGYFQSHKRYVRTSAIEADIAVYGLFTFHARGVMFKDGYYRLIVPAGRKPEVLDKHLQQIAPGLIFFKMVGNLDRFIEYSDEPEMS